jgi:sugar O-acyltransferase (sialic acid O-acetyltransferase NeuD family)
MSSLLLIGAGGHGSVVADAALTMGTWDSIHFVDDRSDVRDVVGLPIVGAVSDLERLARSHSHAVVALGNVRLRLEMLERCRALGYELPAIVHRSAVVSPFATLGPGSVVFAQAAVNPRTSIGRGSIVNTGATVDHDCELGEGVHICPGVHIAGNVNIGARSWIGIGTSVKHGIRIGSDVTIGAGAAVVSDIGAGVTAVGVPARVIKRTT